MEQAAMSKTETKWLQLIKDWEASGLTQTLFCEQQGVTKASFSKWRSKFMKSGECVAKIKFTGSSNATYEATAGFIPFSIVNNESGTNVNTQVMIEISLPYGISLKVPVNACASQ
jgi:hypothetical protein